MDLNEIFMMSNELKSIENDISDINNLLINNSDDVNIHNQLLHLKTIKKELLDKIEVSKEELFLCDRDYYLKKGRVSVDLEGILTEDFENHIGKQYILALLKDRKFKEKNMLLMELLFISSKISSLRFHLMVFKHNDQFISNIFFGYMDDMVKLGMVDINEDGISYRLTDYGNSFFRDNWCLNWQIIEDACMLFEGMSEDELMLFNLCDYFDESI